MERTDSLVVKALIGLGHPGYGAVSRRAVDPFVGTSYHYVQTLNFEDGRTLTVVGQAKSTLGGLTSDLTLSGQVQMPTLARFNRAKETLTAVSRDQMHVARSVTAPPG